MVKVIQYVKLFVLLSAFHLISVQSVFSKSNNRYSEVQKPELKVIGLFQGAALVIYNGKQKLYHEGKSISKDITLVKATTHEATFKIKGKLINLGIDDLASHTIFEEEKQPDTVDEKNSQSNKIKQAKIVRDRSGMFFTIGFINGRRVDFLVDTGATHIAMGQKMADSLFIDYRKGRRSQSQIADGSLVNTWLVTLDRVNVGEIELRNITAGVIEGSNKQYLLLGNSFLGKLKMENEGSVMTLTQKY